MTFSQRDIRAGHPQNGGPVALQICADQACSHCGGSGILRTGNQRFRTCLECLGQGRLILRRPVLQSTNELVRVERPVARPAISVSVSSFAA